MNLKKYAKRTCACCNIKRSYNAEQFIDTDLSSVIRHLVLEAVLVPLQLIDLVVLVLNDVLEPLLLRVRSRVIGHFLDPELQISQLVLGKKTVMKTNTRPKERMKIPLERRKCGNGTTFFLPAQNAI